MTNNNDHLNPLISSEVLISSDSEDVSISSPPNMEDIEFISDYFDFLDGDEDDEFVPDWTANINFDPWGVEWDWLNEAPQQNEPPNQWMTAAELYASQMRSARKRSRDETAAEYHHLPHPPKKRQRKFD